MPYILLKTNVPVSQENEALLHKRLSSAADRLQEVEEAWVMTALEGSCRMWYEGTCEPAALVEVSVYGDCLSSGCDIVTKQITAGVNELLNISKDRIYVKYHQASYWGCGGENFT